MSKKLAFMAVEVEQNVKIVLDENIIKKDIFEKENYRAMNL